jgi:FkbM family methyltransferase
METITKLFLPFISKDDVLVDVGACAGSYTLSALALGAQVYAFEPDPRWLRILNTNIDLNEGFRTRSVLSDKGLWSMECIFAYEEVEDVQATTLDILNIPATYIKIDVDGSEAGVIKGGLRALVQHKPRLLIEHHPTRAPGSDEWIIKTLKDMGYNHKTGNPIDKIYHSLFY